MNELTEVSMDEPRELGEIRYLVLPDSVSPCLLARVRWPDVAQAVSALRPEWLYDPGLFDLPYNPASATVTFARAAAIADDWGVDILADTAEPVPSLIRRLPANWSSLVPAERHAWSLAPARRRARASSPGRVRPLFGIFKVSPVPGRETPGGVPSAAGLAVAPNGTKQPAVPAAERRRHSRTHVVGRAQLRCGQKTVTANLIDVSRGGVRFSVYKGQPAALRANVNLRPPLVLEDQASSSRIRLDVAARVAWHKDLGSGRQLGLAFSDLNKAQVEQIHDFLAALGGGRRP